MCVRMEVEEATDQELEGGIRMRSTRIRKERPSASTTSRGDAPGLVQRVTVSAVNLY